MTPAIPDVLGELAALLMKNAAPGVPDGERASNLGLSAQLLLILAETWDRQAHILVEENRAVRELLGEAAADTDLHLSALQAENSSLRAALIERHAQAEAAGEGALEARIWAELVTSAERRRLSTSPV